jgi:hypothetical protein
MNPPAVFVLHPENRPFLAGKERLPRTARKSGFHLLLIGGGILVCNVILTVAGLTFFAKQTRLLAAGVKTEARVLRLRGQENSADPKAETASSFMIAYRFDAAGPGGRRSYEYETYADEDVYGNLFAGDTVAVIYDPADPNVSELAYKVEDTELTKVLLGFDGLFWLAILWCVVCWWWMVLRPTRRMARLGRVLNGEVVGCKTRLDDEGFYVTVHYGFTDPSGRRIEGESCANRPDLQNQALPAAGAPVLVFYADGAHYVI